MPAAMLAFRAPFLPLDSRVGESLGNAAVKLSRPKLQEITSYHMTGRSLLETAARFGRRETAHAAVEVFRVALTTAGAEDPSIQNGLGSALVEVAQVEPHRPAMTALIEAMECFSLALDGAKALEAPPAALTRFEVNRLMASWLSAERTGDRAQIDDVAGQLEKIATGSSDQMTDRSYGLELLGNVRMAQANPEGAAEAYRSAEVLFRDPEDRARLLTNLAAALAAQGQVDAAEAALRRALRLQLRERSPLAWGRTQGQLAQLLLEAALAQGRSVSISRFGQIVEAFEAARATHQHIKDSRNAISIAVGFGNALFAYGTRLVLARPAQPQDGIDQVRQAIRLYDEIFPGLAPVDMHVGVNNLRVGLELLAQLTGNAEAEVTHTLVLRLKYILSLCKELFYITDVQSIIDLLTASILPSAMADDEKQLIEDISGLLRSSRVPETEWPRVLWRAAQAASTSEFTPVTTERAARQEITTREITARPEGAPIFRNVPAGLARPYSKDPVPDEVLNDPENIAEAYRIQNARKRNRPGAKLIDPADAYLAGRIIRAHLKRLGNG